MNRDTKIIEAANDVCSALFDFAVESGEHLTCLEIDTLAALYRALGRDEAAKDILDRRSSHALHDEEGDDHYYRSNKR